MTIDVGALHDLYATETLGNPEHAVGFVLWRVMHRYQREAERVLRPHGLTHLQFTTLAMVGWMCRSGEAATQAELAREADIHPMQISLMLKALEAKDLVIRLRSTDDTRAKRVTITRTGIEALRVAFPIVIALQEAMFGAAGGRDGYLLKTLRDVEKRNDHTRASPEE